VLDRQVRRFEARKVVDEEPADRRLDSRAAADFLNIERKTLERWRYLGLGPRFVRYSRTCVRYQLSDLKAWVADRTIEPSGMGEAHP
jgi:hypothetical protein